MYVDKKAFDSKKCQAGMVIVISAVLTPILMPRLGMATGVVVEQASVYLAEGIIGLAGTAYIIIQGKIDQALVGKTQPQTPTVTPAPEGVVK